MTQFPQALRSWRAERRYSQLDLALRAEISSRHLSFLETGRARPSRDMVVRLGEALDLPLGARNQLLTQAGFAARYPGRPWDATEMAPIRGAIDRMLHAHLPFPGLAIDRLWTVVTMNQSAAQLFSPLGLGVGDSLLDLMTSDRLPPLIENWPEVARHAAARLRTESLAQGGVAELDQAAEHLARVTGVTAGPAGPVVPTLLKLGDQRLSMFATIAQFGTPEDVMLDDLKIELYFPLDPETERAFDQLSRA